MTERRGTLAGEMAKHGPRGNLFADGTGLIINPPTKEIIMHSKCFHKPLTMFATTSLVLLTIGASSAADLGTVTITHDKEVAARTNMNRPVEDTQTLQVTFDRDVAKRTNMQREASDVAPVKVTQDRAVMERTNMGGIARTPSQDSHPLTTSTK
jgi:hypothetical protein